MGVGPDNEEDQLLDAEKEDELKSSYGFGIALAARRQQEERERLLSEEQNMEGKEGGEKTQKTTLLNLSKSSPTKEGTNTSKEENFRPINENEVFIEEKEANLNRVLEDSDITADHVPRDKQPRKNLQLHLNVHAASNRGQRCHGMDLNTPGSRGTPKPMNVAVFLKEGEHRLLVLEKGKLTTAAEIKTMMLELLSIPKSAAHLFAIWFISPHLEIQLKAHHVPFLLRKQWPNLLVSFSNCQDPVETAQDEPVLVFQRNSFLRVEEEKKFNEDTVIKRLFEEARHNVLMARYPIPLPDAEMLGGMLARIALGPYHPATHKQGCFKKCLQNYLPYYAIGSNKIIEFVKSSNTEQRLLQHYEHATNKFPDVKACQRNFLEYCRSKEFYGCAFFRGVIHQNVKDYKPWKSLEKQVVVGINRIGVSIFKTTKEELIIHIPYDALSWDYVKDESSECLDSFCIEFDSRRDDSNEVDQIQILSRQSCMMDAMVDSCINYMNIMNIPKTPTSAEYRKINDISYSSLPTNKKLNFSLSRSFKR